MFGSAVLDTAIGLVFVFFLFSTLCSSTFSVIGRWLQLRGKLLNQGLLYLLDTDLTTKLLEHPLVKSATLKDGGIKAGPVATLANGIPGIRRLDDDEQILENDPLPKYIPSDVFSRALIDILVEAGEAAERDSGQSWEPIVDALRQEFETFIEQSNQNQTLKEDAKAYINFKLDKLINNTEREGIALVEQLIVDFNITDPQLSQDILLLVRTVFSRKKDLLQLVRRGLEMYNLPEDTFGFIDRQLERLLQEQHLDVTLATLQARVEDFVGGVENWFNNAMDRLTAVYKGWSRGWFLIIAIVWALFFNVNSITIAQTLWANPTLRDTVVQTASRRLNEEEQAVQADAIERGESPADLDPINPVIIFRDDLSALGLPFGWTEQELEALNLPQSWRQVESDKRPTPTTFSFVFGWLFTIAAGVMGAPFWYDVITRLFEVRKGIAGGDKD